MPTTNIYAAENAAFLAKYPTDDAQIEYYSKLAMEVFRVFRIDGSFKFEGVLKNVRCWYASKKKQMELFRKHPCWNEEAKAIIFKDAIKRSIDHIAARSVLAELYSYIRERESLDLPIIIALHDALGRSCFQDSTINEESLKQINRYLRSCEEPIPKRIESMLKVGTKISKLVYKYCTMIPDNDGNAVDVTKLVDEHNPEDRSYQSFEKIYARFSDMLSEADFKTTTIISLHFCDFMTMSNGNSWLTCHYINSHNLFHEYCSHSEGIYKQGCLSYALDEPSFLLYTLPESYDKGTYHMEPKITRMCCQYNNGVLVTGKCYPNNENGIIAQYRTKLHEIISKIEESENSWTFSDHIGIIGGIVTTGENSAHYPDYQHSKQKPSISIRHNSRFSLNNAMVIGHGAYCLHCGKDLDGFDQSWLQCGVHRKDMICQHCGCVIENDEDMHEIDEKRYCDDCVFYCYHHQRYEPKTKPHKIIDAHNGKITICEDASMFYVKCNNCGKYISLSDSVCKHCNTKNKSAIKVITPYKYGVGDYVLMNDTTRCSYGSNYSMMDWKGTIAKIRRYEDDGVYRIYNSSYAYDTSCFDGVVIGANESMIGKKLADIINIEGE